MLDRTDEVHVETEAAGKRGSTIIWVVVTPDGVFVRSYLGARGLWYQRVLRTGQAALRVGRRRFPVLATPERRAAVNRRVDEEFRRKYGQRWPAETEAMVKPSVARTTLRLTPAAAV